MKVAVLVSSGMLGSKMLEICQASGLETKGLSLPNFDAENPDFSQISDCEYVINCIGIIKPYIHDDNSLDVSRAVRINSLFPYILAQTNKKIIQIATDCVWDGSMGGYLETDLHNATDVYGKTKSLGEVKADKFLNLRCSIIGPEKKSFLSLMEWFLRQPPRAEVKGYKNHFWNGLTTEAFSRICVGIIKNNIWFSGMAHIIPADISSKAEMLHIFAEHFNRRDIKITDINAVTTINRTLTTIDSARNAKLWDNAGYKNIPTVRQMIEELPSF